MGEMDANRTTGLIFNIINLSIVLCIALMQWCAFKRSNNTNVLVRRLMWVIVFTNIIMLSSKLVVGLTCISCKVFHSLWNPLFIADRGLALLLFNHRAHVATKTNPVFSDRMFTRVFPAVIVFSEIILQPPMIKWQINTKYRCDSWYNGTFARCTRTEDDGYSSVSWAGFLGLGIETILTLFFLYLFIKPLWNVYGQDVKEMSDTSKKERDKVLRLMKTNFIWTFINLASSLFVITAVLLGETYYTHYFDPTINTFTVFMVLGVNRRYLNETVLRLPVRRMSMSEEDTAKDRLSILRRLHVFTTPPITNDSARESSNNEIISSISLPIYNASN
eukprot:163967_1